VQVTSNQVYRDQQTLRARQTTPVAVPINLTVGDATLQLSATTYKHCGLMYVQAWSLVGVPLGHFGRHTGQSCLVLITD